MSFIVFQSSSSIDSILVFFLCFAHAAISAAEKVIDLSTLFLEMLSSFF